MCGGSGWNDTIKRVKSGKGLVNRIRSASVNRPSGTQRRYVNGSSQRRVLEEKERRMGKGTVPRVTSVTF